MQKRRVFLGTRFGHVITTSSSGFDEKQQKVVVVVTLLDHKWFLSRNTQLKPFLSITPSPVILLLHVSTELKPSNCIPKVLTRCCLFAVVFTFDNSYSWFNSKDLCYSIRTIDPNDVTPVPNENNL